MLSLSSNNSKRRTPSGRPKRARLAETGHTKLKSVLTANLQALVKLFQPEGTSVMTKTWIDGVVNRYFNEPGRYTFTQSHDLKLIAVCLFLFSWRENHSYVVSAHEDGTGQRIIDFQGVYDSFQEALDKFFFPKQKIEVGTRVNVIVALLAYQTYLTRGNDVSSPAF